MPTHGELELSKSLYPHPATRSFYNTDNGQMDFTALTAEPAFLVFNIL